MERHERMRRFICAVCFCQLGRKADRAIRLGSVEERVIRDSIDPTYSILDSRSPAGTCLECRRRLFDVARGKATAQCLQFAVDIDLGLVADQVPCNCYYCRVGSLYGPAWAQWKKEAVDRHMVVLGEERSVRRCGDCFAPLHRGVPHDRSRCSSEVAKVEHLQEALPLATRAKMAVNTMREVAEQEGQSVLQLQGFTGGRPVTVHLGGSTSTSTSPMPVMSAEEAVRMKIAADLSDRYIELFVFP